MPDLQWLQSKMRDVRIAKKYIATSESFAFRKELGAVSTLGPFSVRLTHAALRMR